GGLPDPWVRCDEGPATWSPFDVIGHLIHGERTNWIPRARWIVEHGESKPFPGFDRFAMLEANRGRSLRGLLDEFVAARESSIDALRQLIASGVDPRTVRGSHPALGTVTLAELLATWVAHDL